MTKFNKSRRNSEFPYLYSIPHKRTNVSDWAKIIIWLKLTHGTHSKMKSHPNETSLAESFILLSFYLIFDIPTDDRMGF